MKNGEKSRNEEEKEKVLLGKTKERKHVEKNILLGES